MVAGSVEFPEEVVALDPTPPPVTQFGKVPAQIQ